MPKKKQASSSDDSDSGPDDRTPAKKAKNESSTSSGKSDVSEWELDRNRKVNISDFKGKRYVNIREYYEKDGKTLPGKKGISLSMSQWKKLCDSVEEINNKLKD